MNFAVKYIIQLIVSKAFGLVSNAIALFFKNRKTDKKIEENTNEKDRVKAASTAADILFDD